MRMPPRGALGVWGELELIRFFCAQTLKFDHQQLCLGITSRTLSHLVYNTTSRLNIRLTYYNPCQLEETLVGVGCIPDHCICLPKQIHSILVLW